MGDTHEKGLVSAETYTKFKLPETIETLRTGWLATFQGAATVSALLGGIEAGLLVFFKDETNFGATHASCRCNGPDWIQTTVQKCILSLTYLSLILSLGVTVTSYALTAEFSIFPSRAAKRGLYVNNEVHIIQGPNWDILEFFCLKKRARYVWMYWFFSLVGAVLCSVLSVAVFVATQEDMEIKVTVLVFVGLFILPILSLLWIFKGE